MVSEENMEMEMGFGRQITARLKKAFTIRGRAARSEFWLLQLITIPIYIFPIYIFPFDIFVFDSEYITITPLLVLLLMLLLMALWVFCVIVRRLHDINKSGWWLLLGFIPLGNLVLLFMLGFVRGTMGGNRFGPSPTGVGVLAHLSSNNFRADGLNGK